MASQAPQRDSFDPRQRVIGRRDDSDPVIRLEIYGILILAFAAALFMALVTFDVGDVDPIHAGRTHPAGNAIGPIGAHVADLFLGGIGLGSFALTGILSYLGLSYIIGRRSHLTRMDVLGWIGLLCGGAILLHVMLSPTRMLGHLPGGMFGEYAGEIMRAFLSTPGTVLLAATVVVISIITLTRRSIFELGILLVRGGRGLGRLIKRGLAHGDKAAPADAAAGPEGARDGGADGDGDGDGDDDDDDEDPVVVTSAAPILAVEVPEDGPRIVERVKSPPPIDTPVAADDDDDDDEDDDDDDDAEAAAPELAGEAEPAAAAPSAAAPTPAGDPDAAAPAAGDEPEAKIVESAAMRRRGREPLVGDQLSLEPDSSAYELPSLTLLDYRPPDGTTFDREMLRKNAQILETKLADYGVQGNVVEIHPGPVVTMYEFKPAAGVKISKIAGLSDDLAMALSALRIRIVAPIPGKNVVGIEVPNATREVVWLKEILSDGCYTKAKSKLTLALGKDIVGNPSVMNLAKAPHLLVAGATGSGKSVAINSFIVSLLYSSTPDDVRMIMVDPKMLELSIYEDIPHLLLPVVTDPKQATVALRWAVKEMERRYRQMADMGVRNLSSYNSKVESLLAKPDQELPPRLKMAKAKRAAKGEPDAEGQVCDAAGQPVERLPFIVVIIDELADLMMVASKDVEICIARLAQMARASGIHLILATQRPSVDVITGLIKANFPTRISFQVASKIDSRTILDQGGAQNLLGMGDMLYMPPGTSALKRVHGCFVSDEEIHHVVSHLKAQGSPDYDLGILAGGDEDEDGPGASDDPVDELYDRAVRIVAETRNASISFLQRKLKIGYNRSARIVEQMEEEGVVGPSDGTSRPREVFIDPI